MAPRHEEPIASPLTNKEEVPNCHNSLYVANGIEAALTSRIIRSSTVYPLGPLCKEVGTRSPLRLLIPMAIAPTKGGVVPTPGITSSDVEGHKVTSIGVCKGPTKLMVEESAPAAQAIMRVHVLVLRTLVVALGQAWSWCCGRKRADS